MKVGDYELKEDRAYYAGESVHLWVKMEGGSARVGVDDFTQKLSRGFTFFFVQKKEGDEVKKGENIASLESAKMVLGIESPFTGRITAANKKAESDASIINKDPYGEGWLFEISPSSEEELKQLVQKEKLKDWMETEIKKYGV